MTDEIRERIEQSKRKEPPKGYKLEQGYVIPNEWILKNFSTQFSRLNRKNKEDNQNVLTISAQQGLISQSDYYINPYASEDKTGYSLLYKGDFSYNKSYSADYAYGAIKRLDEYNLGIVSPLYICFEPNKGTHSDFYLQYFEAGIFNRETYKIAQEGARNHGLLNVAIDDFFASTLVYPTYREQSKIAEILTQCDKVITLKKERIEEEKKQKKWLMQKLLDPDSGVRFPGFKGKWKRKRIGELFSVGATFSASREQLSEEGLLYLHYGDIHANTSSTINTVKDYELIPKLNNTQVNENTYLADGDVVFVDASEDYEGACKFVVVENPSNTPYISGLHSIPLKSKTNELSIEFRKHIFHSYAVKLQIWYYVSGMKILGINKQNILRVAIQLPSVEEQTAIADILSSQDRKINLLEHELEQWQQKKKSLMQLLLTGIVRVKV